MLRFVGEDKAFNLLRIGGTESYIRRLIKGLKLHDFKNIHIDYLSDKDVNYVKDGVSIAEHSSIETLIESISFEDHVVIVYLSNKNKVKWFTKYLFRKSKPKISVILFSYPKNRLKRIMSLAIPLLLLVNNKIVTTSITLTRLYKKFYVKRTRCILPPVDDIFFKQSKKIISQPRYTYVGRIEKEKGFENILELVKMNVFTHKMNLHLYSWSDNEYSKNAIDYLDSIENVNVDYTNYSGYDRILDIQLSNILKDTDVLVLPYISLHSSVNLPLLVLEGLAAGCVVYTISQYDLSEIIPKEFSYKSNFQENIHNIFDLEMLKNYAANINLNDIKISKVALSFLEVINYENT